VVEYPRVFDHVGFFFACGADGRKHGSEDRMNNSESTMAQQIAQAASDYVQQNRGHVPQSVSVVLSDSTLVVTLHGALSPAEKALALSAAGAAQLQEFHQRLFANSSYSLREEIRRITGVEVREAAAEIEPATGTVMKVFTTGTVVQVFLLAHSVPPTTWSGSVPSSPI
jgi:uncharacterized protein YbcI